MTVTPDIKYEEYATNRKIQGVDNLLNLFKEWAVAFPDSHATFRNEYVSGNTVILELTWHGTHSGNLKTPKGNLPPTGKKIELPACQVIETMAERAKVVRQYFDLGTLLQQLGV